MKTLLPAIALMAGLIAGAAPLSARDGATVAEVESYLAAHRGLLNHHRGYLELLRQEGGLAETEAAYARSLASPRFRRIEGAFDEALRAWPDAEDAFEGYYEALDAAPEARGHADALLRWQLAQRGRWPVIGDGVRRLLAEGDEGMQALAGGGGTGAVKVLGSYLERNPEARAGLVEALEGLNADPQTRDRIVSWWRLLDSGPEAEATAEAAGVPAAFRNLDSYLMNHAGDYWAWHGRNVALAGAGEAGAWVRYWQRRVRREEALETSYWDYLELLDRRPELRDAAARRWGEFFGPVPSWPPSGTPPELPPVPSGVQWRKTGEWTGHAVTPRERSGRPVAPRPRRPVRPVPPTRDLRR